MHEIDLDNLPRRKTYDWFNSFNNPTYGLTVKLDVTSLVEHTKKHNESFFINMLYIVVKALNSVDNLRMRFENNEPVLYDEINPAITVMIKNEIFENVRLINKDNYKEFYEMAKERIDKAKYQDKLNNESYNSTASYNEYYITCLPWTDFISMTHPIPEDKSSQTVPRVCWGKYIENNGKYEISLNITVSHVFVDGYHLSKVFNVCEGFNGPARESVYGAILEQLKINYSGPDSTNLLMCHNKYLVKNILKNSFLVPFGYTITNKEEIELLKNKNIEYPVIVKLNSEGSSMGMTKDSIVYNYNDLHKEVCKLLDKYDRTVLIEQYISGKDISMIYVEGLGALGPCIVNCDSEFYDYEMKSIKDDTVDIKTLDGKFNDLKDTVCKMANRLDIKGYAKLDFRLHDDKCYLIEINSQVSFHPEGEFITCAKKDGYEFNDIVSYIVSRALTTTKKINSVGIRGDINE